MNRFETVYRLIVLGLGFVATLLLTTRALAQNQPAFVQQNYANPQSRQNAVTVSYSSVQTAGNTNIIAIGWNDTSSSISSVTDSLGNTYQRAIATYRSRGLSQAIYYASNIRAGNNSVTVKFSARAPAIDLRVTEYKGLAASPFAAGASASGSGTSARSGAVSVSAGNSLLFAAGMASTVFRSAGSDFTLRVITSPHGDITQDRIVTAAGSYRATASLRSGSWIMQVAAFKGASVTAPTPGIAGVDLTSPSNGASFQAGAVVNISATATAESGASISKMEFYDGAIKLGEDLSSPYSLSISNLLVGSHSLTAKAIASTGLSKSSTAVSISVVAASDSQAPTAPAGLAGSAASSSQINLTWNASSDNVGVTGYRVYRNNALVATRTQLNFSDTGLQAATNYSYQVSALDAAGNESAKSSLNVATQAAQSGTTGCPLAGGTSASPVNLANFISSNTQCTQFNLGDGYFSSASISRSNIVIKADNKCMARLGELTIRGQNVTVDGVSITVAGTAVNIYKSGVKFQNSCLQGFGKTQYGNGIWIFQEALDPNNKIIIQGNQLNDWGGSMYSGGIAIGKSDDNYAVPTTISVEVLYNRITGGPTQAGIYNAAIQAFHPFLAYGNYIHTVSGTSFQNKTFNSRVACNEAVNIIGDGALYNRLDGNNIWEYNLVHDSDVGIDHFIGDGSIYRGNVIYNVDYWGRIKNQGDGSTNLLFENNTFYNSTAWAGFIWDATSSGALGNIMWRKNIFHTGAGGAINSSASLDPAWDETENIFFRVGRPSGTTGAAGGSASFDPKLASPTTDFTALDAAAAGKGALWPRPCQ